MPSMDKRVEAGWIFRRRSDLRIGASSREFTEPNFHRGIMVGVQLAHGSAAKPNMATVIADGDRWVDQV